VPKHGQTSVARNRLKRRLRELVRVRVLPQLTLQDVVFRTLPSAYAQNWTVLSREIDALLARLPSVAASNR
jgi:ribonuclease P protein component